MLRRTSLAVFALCANACASRPASPAAHPATSITASPVAATKKIDGHPPLFREGKYEDALAEARRRGVPLAVEVWAEWCSPCMAMRGATYPAPEMYEQADRFVWLAVQRDDPQADALMKKLHFDAMPTLVVVDSRDESPLLRWVGATDAPTLSDALRLAGQPDTPAATPEDRALVEALRFAAPGGDEARARAVTPLCSALALAPTSWPRRAMAASLLADTLADARDSAGCLAVADAELQRLPPSGPASAVAATAIGCAGALKRPADVARFADALLRIAEDENAPMADWSRVASLSKVAGAKRDAGDSAAADRIRASVIAFLERASARTTGTARAVLAPRLAWALRAVQDHDHAVDALIQAERDMPGDFETSLYLAWELSAAGRYREALAAMDRSASKVSHPRRLDVLWAKANMAAKHGDPVTEAAVLDAALAEGPTDELTGYLAEIAHDIRARRDTMRATDAP